MKYMKTLFLLLLSLLVAACGKELELEIENPTIIVKGSSNINIGQSLEFSAEWNFPGDPKDLVWTTSNSHVTLTPIYDNWNGKQRYNAIQVTGESAGTATIKASLKGQEATLYISVSTADLSNWTSTNTTGNSSSSHTWTFSAVAGTTLRFNYLVSSEANYDVLTITLDGSTIVTASGEQSSSFTRTFTSSGSHTLVATYSKDNSINSGSDQASVYNITLNN